MKASTILNNIFAYCDKATIGVLKYISRRSLSKLERIFWILCIVVALITSFFLINEVIEKFLEHKIAIKISEKQKSVEEIPFPAISICPELLISEESYNEALLNQG